MSSLPFGTYNAQNANHISRHMCYVDYPQRTPVALNAIHWQIQSPNYAPALHDAPEQVNGLQADPADPARLANLTQRISVEPASITLDSSGRPLNPYGRTGIVGRGALPYWGPNLFGGLAVTRHDVDEKLEILLNAALPKNCPSMHIPHSPVRLDANRLPLEAAAKALAHTVEIRHASLIYRGYVDSSRNTDNAWEEWLLYHVHVSHGESLMINGRLGTSQKAPSLYWTPAQTALAKTEGGYESALGKAILNMPPEPA